MDERKQINKTRTPRRVYLKGEINLISRNQLFKTKSAYKPKSLGQIHSFFYLYDLICVYTVVFAKLYDKISTLGVDFDHYFYVSIDFLLNTQIENIGRNQPPKSILFREILHTAF